MKNVSLRLCILNKMIIILPPKFRVIIKLNNVHKAQHGVLAHSGKNIIRDTYHIYIVKL